jgi:hypothetical protein
MFRKALCNILPSLLQRFSFPLSYQSWITVLLDETIYVWGHMFKVLSPILHLLFLIGTNCKILKPLNYGNKMKELRLECEAWSNISVWSQQLVKKWNTKTRWSNVFDTVYNIKEQKTWHNQTKTNYMRVLNDISQKNSVSHGQDCDLTKTSALYTFCHYVQ